jgi:benzodiazapine receptor
MCAALAVITVVFEHPSIGKLPMSAIFQPPGSLRKWLALGILLGLVFAISALGSLVTVPKISSWYAGLIKPSFNPPSWVFGPVWTILYVIMAIAAWRIWLRPASKARRAALVWFGVQLALNAVWSPIFFGLEQPRLALAIIMALLITLAMAVFRFFSVDLLAGWMLVPYLAWTGFASVLNGTIVALN